MSEASKEGVGERMRELLPCPFCGGEAEHSQGTTGDGKPWPYIECVGCRASAEPSVWNERATPSSAEYDAPRQFTEAIALGDPRVLQDIRGHALEAITAQTGTMPEIYLKEIEQLRAALSSPDSPADKLAEADAIIDGLVTAIFDAGTSANVNATHLSQALARHMARIKPEPPK